MIVPNVVTRPPRRPDERSTHDVHTSHATTVISMTHTRSVYMYSSSDEHTRSISSKTTPPRVSEPRREGDSKRDAREPRRTSRDAPSHEPRNASREQTRAPRHARSRRVSARGGDSPRRLTIEFESVYLLTFSGRSLGEGDVKKHRERGRGEEARRGGKARRRGEEETRRRGGVGRV